MRRVQPSWWTGGCIRPWTEGRYRASIERLEKGGGHKKQENREENNGEGKRQMKEWKCTKKRENPTHKGGGEQNRVNVSCSGEIFHSGLKVTMLFLVVWGRLQYFPICFCYKTLNGFLEMLRSSDINQRKHSGNLSTPTNSQKTAGLLQPTLTLAWRLLFITPCTTVTTLFYFPSI